MTPDPTPSDACCVGEPFGDFPAGQHTFVCPVYLANVEGLERLKRVMDAAPVADPSPGELLTNAEQFTPDPADVELVTSALPIDYEDYTTLVEVVQAKGGPRYVYGRPGRVAKAVLRVLTAAGRLIPPDAGTRPDGWAVRVTLKNGTVSIRHGDDGFVTRESAEQMADYARRHPAVSVAEVVTRREWVGPWLPVPDTTDRITEEPT